LLIQCSGFQKTLNKGKPEEQYAMAVKLYEEGKYNRAIQLFEKVIPFYRGKPQMERIQYMFSMANYKEGNYLLSGYHFNRFTKNYPRSTKREEAMFLAAHSYYLSTPRSSLDQSDTKEAIEAFQRFIDFYPDSPKVKEANKYIRELEKRLEKKDFDIAYQYLHTGRYKAAVVAFDNFLSEHLGTKYKEDALFYKAKAAYLLAKNSIESKKAERIKKALKAVNRLLKNFPDGKYNKEALSIQSDLTDLSNIYK
jgi:outer membrane protein assembly factor BamD